MTLHADAPLHDRPLADLAVSATATRVFHRHGLDFCCGGGNTLRDACARKGLDVDAIASELEAARAASDPDERDWREAPAPELIAHLLERYHEGHRAELPRLIEMARKVERVHGARDDCPRGLTAFLESSLDSLESHLQKEEQILFPMIQQGRGRSAGMPIQVMEHEHAEHGHTLERLRELTNDYTPPQDACTTWRALYDGLAEFQRELMQHIHLENNVLFPGVLAPGS